MIFRFSAHKQDGAGGLFCAVCFGVGKFSFDWCFLSKWGIMGLSQRAFGPLSQNGPQQNGKNVVADVLSAEKTGGSLSEELGALPGRSSNLTFSKPVGAGANHFYIDREEKEIT